MRPPRIRVACSVGTEVIVSQPSTMTSSTPGELDRLVATASAASPLEGPVLTRNVGVPASPAWVAVHTLTFPIEVKTSPAALATTSASMSSRVRSASSKTSAVTVSTRWLGSRSRPRAVRAVPRIATTGRQWLSPGKACPGGQPPAS